MFTVQSNTNSVDVTMSNNYCKTNVCTLQNRSEVAPNPFFNASTLNVSAAPFVPSASTVGIVGLPYNSSNYPSVPDSNTLLNSHSLFNQNIAQAALTKNLSTQPIMKNSFAIFDGTAHKFHSWVAQIKSRTQGLNLSPAEILNIMESNSTGPPHELLSGLRGSMFVIDIISSKIFGHS